MRNKIGIIGLGDIARKAYLPVITTRDVDLHLCSRDKTRLSDIGSQYRICNLYNDLDSLIASGINMAFVHTATSSHEAIVKKLLENNIHVYVDKPVTDSYNATEQLVSLAKSKGLLLKAGFNRRYAPAYANLKNIAKPNMIVMQKNRTSLPGEIRTFIFDDFIHVVDTLLFLTGESPKDIEVKPRVIDGKLYHIVLTLTTSDGAIAVGIMNRDAGTTEERLELFSSSEKRTVVDLVDPKFPFDPWQTMLRTRGFEDIVDSFLNEQDSNYSDILQTHRICEDIVTQLTTHNP
ncbi:MAG TPA: Gfo/Idh/MocA family oxidoreductase [Cyclobacteriaceae bacterium]